MASIVVEFPPDDRAPAQARRAIAQLLAVGDPSLDDARIVVSELVTNVVRHIGGGGVFRAADSAGSTPLRVEVQDASPDVPVVQRPLPDEIGGRGVALIDQLADRWGIIKLPAGKIVWAEFDRELPAAPTMRTIG